MTSDLRFETQKIRVADLGQESCVPDDIREGEDALGEIWKELYRSVYKKEGKLPHKFNFQAN